ncbi:hypothetical protein [Peptoniphilus sp. HMSC062D09]|uniref:hypothetical protein n=1 Tax=Peptoniphilus sp. HMSC062D09 TaxID=1739305 RepID=UPI0008A143DE|nr:hypothetical protein [Peptoniphilus sp. HMSC062D09]OFK81170.1 hypothetical protein HMPREF2801_06190 [Peptoniphilus sp. HMSC062D09]
MTDTMINVFAGFILALIFFKFIEKLSKEKFLNKNTSKEERLVDYYSSASLIICTFISSVYSIEKLVLYPIGAYLLILLFLKVFMSDRKKFREIDILKTKGTIISLIFTIYQITFFLTLKDGTVIKNFNRSAYVSTMIYLLIGFIIFNLYFLIKILRTIFIKKDIYRKVFTIIDIIFILSQAFFIIYNLVRADRFVFYLDKFM